MFTTPEIICDVFSFLDKDQIERIQLINQFWNNVIIRHKNILPLRQFVHLVFDSYHITLFPTIEKSDRYTIGFGINYQENNIFPSSPYQMTVDEVLKNLNDVVFDSIRIRGDLEDDLLNMVKLVRAKTGSKVRGKIGSFYGVRLGSKLDEIVDNYIIVDKLHLSYNSDSYIREVCANPEIVQFPSTPKEIRLASLRFDENDEVLHFTCNGKLNEANRLTIKFWTSETNYGNFIRQWFELYRMHQNPVSLVGKFESYITHIHDFNVLGAVNALAAVKTFLNNTQLRVKYSLETKEFYSSFYDFIIHYLKRSCVLHETDSYALVIEMSYRMETDMSSINASDLDQPSCDRMKKISFCVKSL